jgi:oxygen-dependent protoporphyrinogen oxidase
MQQKRRIAIIGGGVSGLAAAYEIATRHHDLSFTLYEASDRLGGIVETVHEQGFTIECGPDSWVTEKPWARALAVELGLSDEIISSNDHQRRTYLVQGRQLVPMPEGMRMMVPAVWEPLVHSPLLSWQAKQAYLREPKRAEELRAAALALRGDDADESVADFVVRHFGEEATRMLAGPLLAGVFGGDIYRLSVRAVMAPFVKMEAEYGSLVVAVRARASTSVGTAPVFTSLKSGLGTLIHRMVESLPTASIRMQEKVTSVTTDGQQWTVRADSGDLATYDALLIALPAAGTRRLLASMHHPAADRIDRLLPMAASSALCVALGYLPEKAARLRISRGFGFLAPPANSAGHAATTTPPGETVSLLAATFVDQKFAHRVPPGGILLRGFFGGHAAESLRAAGDATVAEETRRQLSLLLGPLPAPDVTVVRHWPQSLPQYEVGHTFRMRQLAQLLDPLPNLHLLGNAYNGVGLPDLIRDARAAANAIVSVRTLEAIP